MKVQTYTQNGKKGNMTELPDAVFGVSWNADLVHHVVQALRSNMRSNTAHAKDRAAVRGGGRKPWRQKGPGRARHGSIRSPMWIGGGVAHGPSTERTYRKKVNKKERAKALYAILSRKAREGEVICVEGISLSEPKTREAQKVLNAISSVEDYSDLSYRSRNAALIVMDEVPADVKRAFANINTVSVHAAQDISAVDAATFKYVMVVNPEVTAEALLNRRTGAKRAHETVSA